MFDGCGAVSHRMVTLPAARAVMRIVLGAATPPHLPAAQHPTGVQCPKTIAPRGSPLTSRSPGQLGTRITGQAMLACSGCVAATMAAGAPSGCVMPANRMLPTSCRVAAPKHKHI